MAKDYGRTPTELLKMTAGDLSLNLAIYLIGQEEENKLQQKAQEEAERDMRRIRRR